MIGIGLIIVLGVELEWLPTQGYVSFQADPVGSVKSTLLPAITLGIGVAAATMRILRPSLLDVGTSSFVRTAKGKGLLRKRMVVRHELPNASIPAITAAGIIVAHLVGGAVIVEYVFARPGLGSLLVDSVYQRDYGVLQALVLLAVAVFIVTSLSSTSSSASSTRAADEGGHVSTTVPTLPLEVTPAARPDSVIRRLLRRPTGAVAAVVALLVAARGRAALRALLADHARLHQLFAPPSREHLFGTDELGRDLLTRVLYGGRTSILLGFAATAFAMTVGVVWGFAAALREGWIGEILMRVADTVMAMPAICSASSLSPLSAPRRRA